MGGRPPQLGTKLGEAPCKVVFSGQPDSDALAELYQDGLLLKPQTGTEAFIPYLEMSRVESGNYGIHLVSPAGIAFLSALGPLYGPFYQHLVDARGDAFAKALLMSEEKVIREARATYINVKPDGSQGFGPCRVRVQPSGVVVVPSEDGPFKLAYPRVVTVLTQNSRVNVETSDKGVFEFLRMGSSYQAFCEALIAARRDFEGEWYQMLVAFSPGIGFDRILELSRLMAEGRSLTRADVLQRSYDFWLTLSRLAGESPLKMEFARLQTVAAEDLISIGLRKGPSGIDVWTMAFIPGSVMEGGNTVAVGISTPKGPTTLLFRAVERKKFASSTAAQLTVGASRTMWAVNEGLVATGFNVDPIVLKEGELASSAQQKYVYATRNLPELALLRNQFYGHLDHLRPSLWEADLREAMMFNVRSDDDRAMWGGPVSPRAVSAPGNP